MNAINLKSFLEGEEIRLKCGALVRLLEQKSSLGYYLRISDNGLFCNSWLDVHNAYDDEDLDVHADELYVYMGNDALKDLAQIFQALAAKAQERP